MLDPVIASPFGGFNFIDAVCLPEPPAVVAQLVYHGSLFAGCTFGAEYVENRFTFLLADFGISSFVSADSRVSLGGYTHLGVWSCWS
jgi:hypothetical protein